MKGRKTARREYQTQFYRSTAEFSDAPKDYDEYDPYALGSERRARKWQNRLTGTLVDISFALGALNDVEKPCKGTAHPPRPLGVQHVGGTAF